MYFYLNAQCCKRLMHCQQDWILSKKNHELMQPLSKKLICPLSDFCCCFLSKGVQFHWIHELWFCGSNELAAGNVYFYG